MCLGVPGKIVEIYEKGGLKMAKVEFFARLAWIMCQKRRSMIIA